jgi:hypothetical protein
MNVVPSDNGFGLESPASLPKSPRHDGTLYGLDCDDGPYDCRAPHRIGGVGTCAPMLAASAEGDRLTDDSPFVRIRPSELLSRLLPAAAEKENRRAKRRF